MEQVPVRFDDLPLLPITNLRHAWGLYGRNDTLGTLNRLDNRTVVKALATPITGDRIGLSLPINLPHPPFFGREPVTHVLFAIGSNTWDERLDSFYPQGSTQWDGLRHVSAGEDGFYGGEHGDPNNESNRIRIDEWVNQGIIGRGVLVDLTMITTYDPFEPQAFEVDDLEAALSSQGSALRYGDILCIHTGWIDKYLSLDNEERHHLAERFRNPATYRWAGLSRSENMSRFLWNSGLSAIACDNPAVEVAPGDPGDTSLHQRLIPCLGFVLGELFDFTLLSQTCNERRRFEFLFASVPLNVMGGVGSPGSAIAVL